jgi:hypothetical protein
MPQYRDYISTQDLGVRLGSESWHGITTDGDAGPGANLSVLKESQVVRLGFRGQADPLCRSVIVPLVPASDLDSGASPVAFGATATSLPPSPVSMAETLVHEFQHIKLGALMDVLPLANRSDERGYAPWREDPRPMGGLLQRVYAFTGIARFWSEQRQLTTGLDDSLRTDLLCERWRLTIELVTRDPLASGVLTPDGTRFVTLLRERGQHQGSGPVPADAAEIPRAVALASWLTWQLRREAGDRDETATSAAAYQRGEPPGGEPVPRSDVAQIQVAGHRPVPFRQFILKVHSRCNLACSYCYVYEMADQRWRGLPRRMSQAVAGKTVERIAEHAERHGDLCLAHAAQSVKCKRTLGPPGLRAPHDSIGTQPPIMIELEFPKSQGRGLWAGGDIEGSCNLATADGNCHSHQRSAWNLNKSYQPLGPPTVVPRFYPLKPDTPQN